MQGSRAGVAAPRWILGVVAYPATFYSRTTMHTYLKDKSIFETRVLASRNESDGEQTMRFKDKNIVIWGGNSGIGLAAAIEFRREGGRVFILGRNPETLSSAQREVGPDTKTLRADISDLAALDGVYEEVRKSLGSIDVLFVNSGIGGAIPFAQMTVEKWDEMFNVNLRGPYFAVQRALPLMKSGASIVLTSSIGHLRGWPGNSHYAAAKAGIRSLARNIGVELVGQGIRVNCLSPGPIDTPLLGRSGMEALREPVRESNPMKRFGNAAEAARAALFLASNDASYITGVDLTVDGGICSF
jgi:NAD(P)-dependent dehydrogenase (short-subunit alcohol dehydrogenase family)